MWSDNETNIDFLGFEHLVTAVTTIIRNDNLLPTTIGVFGDWGSGKSSLMQMVKADLEKDKDVLVLSFNGWLFEGYEDAKTALMGTIIDEIRERRKPVGKAMELCTKLAKRVNWFRWLGTAAKYGLAFAAGGPAGVGLVGAVDVASVATEAAKKAKDVNLDEISKFFKEETAQELRRAVREFRDDFEELLKETKIRTLVVLIDDLDRCLPNTIIETLEAIKLFLFVPRSAFVIGADERLVKYAVRLRFPELPGSKVEVGRDYLEKLVQFPVRVPALARAEMETYINLLFTQAAGVKEEAFEKVRSQSVTCDAATLNQVRLTYGAAKEWLGEDFPDGLAENLELAQRLAPALVGRLNGNPRQCKRFLNTLMLRLHMAESRKIELQQRVLAKLMLLEYLRPEAFRHLGRAQAEQNGRPDELKALEEEMQSMDIKDDEDGEATESQREGRGKSAGRRKAVKAPTPGNKLLRDTWLNDEWIREWLSSEPRLGGEDLGPYFYFARDQLSSLGGSIHGMSPLAQQILSDLLGESDASRTKAIERLKEANAAEITGIFEALNERVRGEEDLGAESSALARAFDVVQARPDYFGELVGMLGSVPEASLPPSAVPRLIGLARDSQHKSMTQSLFEQWSQQTMNQPLRKAVEKNMKKLK